ncbi:hypothetical protein [Streptomyces sp. NRRL S-37]|uniref:hypothetical protein n=1 Tax=Streptomyces sp. NRRL S-37 TaxID=1463903 RepID=UPI00131B4146|nr:hypothetical protein [Streptomyces sp. NRRL S-37]
MEQASGRPVASIAVRGRNGSVWLEGRAVRLSQDGLQRRIPLTAVEEVRLGAEGSVEVVLTASPGVSPTVYRLDGGARRAADQFARTVNEALPRRVPGTPVRDGEQLVEVLGTASPSARLPAPAGRWRSRLVITVSALLYLAGLAVFVAAGDTGRAMLWGIGVLPLGSGGFLLFLGMTWWYDRIVLNRRGVSVMATHARGFESRSHFAYVDLQGVKREIFPSLPSRHYGGDYTRLAIVFDPLRPTRAAPVAPGRHFAAQISGPLAIGLPLLALGLFMVPYQMVDFLYQGIHDAR